MSGSSKFSAVNNIEIDSFQQQICWIVSVLITSKTNGQAMLSKRWIIMGKLLIDPEESTSHEARIFEMVQ